MQDLTKKFGVVRISEDLCMILPMVVFNESSHMFARAFSLYFSSKTMKHPLKMAALKIGPKLLKTSGIRGDAITWNFTKIVILNVYFQNLDII